MNSINTTNNKNIYYYLILFATLLITFSLIPIVFEIIEQKITSNIPYVSLICMLISFLIYLFITIHRKYYIHVFFYLIQRLPVGLVPDAEPLESGACERLQWIQ